MHMSDSSLWCCRHSQEGIAQLGEHPKPGHDCTAAVSGNPGWLYTLSAQYRYSHSTANEDNLCACECAADRNTNFAVFDRLSLASVTALIEHALSMVGIGYLPWASAAAQVFAVYHPVCRQIATHSNLAGDAGVTAVYVLQCML